MLIKKTILVSHTYIYMFSLFLKSTELPTTGVKTHICYFIVREVKRYFIAVETTFPRGATG